MTIGNLCVTLLAMIIIKEYIDTNDRSPYAKWFNRLNAPAAARVVTALVRIEQGNFSNVKGIGGGTKKRQNKDIEVAKALWKEYKNRKRREL